MRLARPPCSSKSMFAFFGLGGAADNLCSWGCAAAGTRAKERSLYAISSISGPGEVKMMRSDKPTCWTHLTIMCTMFIRVLTCAGALHAP